MYILDLSYNQLSGIVPSFVSGFIDIRLSYNQFTFAGMEGLANKAYAKFSPQADIPLIRNGNVFSVAAVGRLSDNTYKWYKEDLLVS